VEDPGLRAQFGVAARRYAESHLGKETVLEQFERDLLYLLQNG
jgi:colanic acid biosynthesis glycosyl transferase WcaI